MDEIPINPRPTDGFVEIIGQERTQQLAEALAVTRDLLGGATVWHVNSTAAGGGVSEMLQSVLSYPAAAGIRVRWIVIERLHHLLHGSAGDGGQLGDEEHRLYERTIGPEERPLTTLVRAGDLVVLHDPQVLGLARCLSVRGATVIWSCHVGADEPNHETRRAWEFLLPYLTPTAAQTFTRAQYRWETLDPARVAVIPPCIDAFATKNKRLDDTAVGEILNAAGLVRDPQAGESAEFPRQDGSTGRVRNRVRMVQDAPLDPEAPIVCQISRWDPLKDHAGVMRAFAACVPPELGAQLVLAGPSPDSVDDDPESKETLAEIVATRDDLPPERRQRVHICSVPMDDLEENAAIINALQRRSGVIVQKSLAEGFGLTVAEAMWKGTPTIGSRVGGIQDQIESGESGLLVDPRSDDELGSAIESLLSKPAAAAEMAENARQRVAERYLAPSYLIAQQSLIRRVAGGSRQADPSAA